MGVFNAIRLECPSCGAGYKDDDEDPLSCDFVGIEFQSKAWTTDGSVGDVFDSLDALRNEPGILADIAGDAEECKSCGRLYHIELTTIATLRNVRG